MAPRGWERTYGRAPTEDDLVVPTRNMTERGSPESQEALLYDLAGLELRHRRGHDLRATFITLAQVDGADREVRKSITHGNRSDIISQYTRSPGATKCAAVEKLKITLPDPAALTAVGHNAGHSLGTREKSARDRWARKATPAGFEGASGSASSRETRETPDGEDPPCEASHGFWAQSGHSLHTVRRLLRVLESAVRAHDVPRGLQVIEQIRAGLGGRPALASVKTDR